MDHFPLAIDFVHYLLDYGYARQAILCRFGDPAFDSFISTSRNGFPFIICCRTIALNYAHFIQFSESF
jgi:hypothetical protein